eukprot:TRINITY_DN239_c1_g1_i11.p1 TRINITY_DN239_c1_g1~~TRINITY_DN239_c1_g1_i11.p1  ORF type:complete len:558 (-),score=44.77 TRINITY_DN239_c1_g1_i11:2674-4212(-)
MAYLQQAPLPKAVNLPAFNKLAFNLRKPSSFVRKSQVTNSVGTQLPRVTKKSCVGSKRQREKLVITNSSSTQVENMFSAAESESKEGSSTYFQALFNCVNILMGVGILSIPYALKEGGWASLGVLSLLAVCTNYTGKILAKCQEVPVMYDENNVLVSSLDLSEDEAQEGEEQKTVMEGQRTFLESYEDIGEAAFGQFGRRFITMVLYTELIGTCSLFFILEGDHLQLLLQSILGRHYHLPSQEVLMAMSAGLFVPTTWLKDLGALSYVGAMGVCSALGLTGVVLYNFFAGGIHIADTSYVNMAHLPVTFGLTAFVFAGHAVFPSIRMSMKDKHLFPKVLDRAYFIVLTACIAIGAAGYLMYGNRTLEEVTLNLPRGLMRDAAIGLILVSPFTKFALTLEPVAQGLEETIGIKKNAVGGDLIAKSVRTALGLSTLALAAGVPFFGYVMAVIGSFLTLTVSVIFPSMCYLRLYENEIDSRETWFNYFIIALGVLCAVFGSYTSINDLLTELSQA